MTSNRAGVSGGDEGQDYKDMTTRERFTMAAMQGLCANPHAWEELIDADLARRAVEIADHQLAALAESEKKDG